ncbi:MAG: hypothetical protein K2K09_06345, partial [Lachnospiraceae bacterium]|nr:hypothetical protein [Lachnospiraceae bacterium]
MLGKLIKHEFIATGRILSILFAVLLIISPTTALYCRFRTTSIAPDNFFLNLMELLCRAAFIIALIAAGITTVIVLLNRFYQSMVTRESYLTHTLPVTTSQLVMSKLIVAVAWQIMTIFVMFISMGLFAAVFGTWTEFASGADQFAKFMAEFGISSSNIVILFISILVSITVAYIKCYASFALGHMINGHPFLGFIVSYIAISIISQIIASILLTICTV